MWHRLNLSWNGSLADLDGLQNLATVGGDVSISNNRALPTSAAQALADRLVAAGAAGKVAIKGNKP